MGICTFGFRGLCCVWFFVDNLFSAFEYRNGVYGRGKVPKGYLAGFAAGLSEKTTSKFSHGDESHFSFTIDISASHLYL